MITATVCPVSQQVSKALLNLTQPNTWTLSDASWEISNLAGHTLPAHFLLCFPAQQNFLSVPCTRDSILTGSSKYVTHTHTPPPRHTHAPPQWPPSPPPPFKEQFINVSLFCFTSPRGQTCLYKKIDWLIIIRWMCLPLVNMNTHSRHTYFIIYLFYI